MERENTQRVIVSRVRTSPNEVMELVWKYIELVGESPESFADATAKAIAEAAKSVRGMEWFEVTSLRGAISGERIKNFQAVVKVGFKVER